MPGTTQAQNGRHHVQRGSDAAEAADQQADDPVVGAVSYGKRRRGQGRIGKPADVRRAAGAVQSEAADEAEVQNDAAQRAHPEAPGIQARKRHVARPDHQRNQIIGETKYDGHGSEEDHGRAMHGEQAIEDFGRDEVIVGDRQLGAHDRGFHATDHQEQDAVAEVHQPQPLVIDRDDPVVQHLHQRAGSLALRRNDQGRQYWLRVGHQFLQTSTASSSDTPLQRFVSCSSSCIAGIRQPGLIASGSFDPQQQILLRIRRGAGRQSWCGSSSASGRGRTCHWQWCP